MKMIGIRKWYKKMDIWKRKLSGGKHNMNILVLYALLEKKPRKTILDSLYCFSKYDKKNHYYYLDVLDTTSVRKIIHLSHNFTLSAVIVHYSAIAERYDQVWWKANKNLLIKLLNQYSCAKIIIPQDEYNYNGCVREFIKKTGIQYIYTCAYQEDYEKLYPKNLNYKKIETVFTGYIDDETLQKIRRTGYDSPRAIDIGYRARKLPYWIGKHGQLKYELAEVFLDYLKDHNEVVYDIANTGEQNQNVLFGGEWIEYLLKCRTMLGCLGGSGLLDLDGSIAKSVDAYCAEHPDASFDEVEQACFPGKDNEIHLFALSPRHFECAMTKTCQVLVEGNYGGVFQAGVDYIEIKKDFSNIADVVEKIKDVDYCRKIAENCYEHVVLSGKYTYAAFVNKIICNIDSKYKKKNVFHLKLWLLCKASGIFSVSNLRVIYRIKFKNPFSVAPVIRVMIRLKSLCRDYGFQLLGKIFKLFRPFKNTRWHKFLKKKWIEFMEKRDG